MPKLILSASLLLILEISIAQTANDGNKNIIAPYTVCFKGLGAKDSLTKEELLEAGSIDCCFDGLQVKTFTLAFGGDCLGPGLYTEIVLEGNRFSDMMINTIHQLKPGYPIWFDDIVVQNKKG